MNMTPGANAPVPLKTLRVTVLSGAAADASAFRLYADGKVQGDPDMVFYGQPQNDDNTISWQQNGSNTVFTVDVSRLRQDVQKVAFVVTCDGGQTVAGLRSLEVQVEADREKLLSGIVDTAGRQEAALILGELYRRNNEWKFRFVAQGFNGGLKPLAEHFGVDVAAESAPAPAPAPKPAESKISLSKISLSKEKPSISLSKRDNFGEIRINLNWHRDVQNSNSGGFLSNVFGGGNKGIDLDLGAFVELQNGQKSVIQALGNAFGDYRREPFIQLQGDDRTGAVSEGEWLHINGGEWKHIRQILIYAFIYQGVPSWDKTDGVVTVFVPEQPPVETRLTEGDDRRTMCAIARLVNENGAIKVERLNRFFKNQSDMDEAFGWGFRWKAGSK